MAGVSDLADAKESRPLKVRVCVIAAFAVLWLIYNVLIATQSGDDQSAGLSRDIPRESQPLLSSEGMTLDEIALGIPGQIALSCPDEATVAKMKSAGKEFGPCDPLPEEGQPIRVPFEVEPEDARVGGGGCAGGILSKGDIDLRFEITCAPGAEIVGSRAVKIDEAYCVNLTYIARTGSPVRTEILCEGDVPTVGGRVYVPSAAVGRHP